ncbi:MAG: hypothetical protein IJ608_00005 [Lachnospiraceae bacterium]|nr:hypothetical protein [Lachnospiraceae bacterium]
MDIVFSIASSMTMSMQRQCWTLEDEFDGELSGSLFLLLCTSDGGTVGAERRGCS